MGTERLTRSKAIRAKCLDCCNGERQEVKLCQIKRCPLWIYRLGGELAPDGSRIPKKPKRTNENDTSTTEVG